MELQLNEFRLLPMPWSNREHTALETYRYQKMRSQTELHLV